VSARETPFPAHLGNGRQTHWFSGLALFSGFVGTFWLAAEMAGVSVAIASCLVLSVSAMLVRRSCYVFNIRRGTITAFWYITYLAMIFFPAFGVYSDQEGPYRAKYLFAVESVLITVPLGWWLANLWSGFRREEIDRFFESSLEDTVTGRMLMRRFWLSLVICLAFTGAYLAEVKAIPLFYLIRNPGEAFQAAILREESFKLLDSPLLYFYQLVRAVFYPILILIALGSYLRFRQRRWLVMLIAASSSGLFFASLTLAKAPVALIFLLIGVFLYLYRRGSLSRKTVAIVLVLVFMFPLFVVTFAFSGGSGEIVTPLAAMIAIGSRLFSIPSEAVYYYFEYFPGQVNYLHGRSIDKLARIMGKPPFDTANAIGLYAFNAGLESVTENAAFIGDLNADFGMWGVVLGGVLAGVVMQAVQILILRRRKTVVTLACFSFLIIAFWFLQSTSLPVVLASNGVILTLVLGWYFDREPLSGVAITNGSAA
jgi:oligosaccharide repeat unit polymerase